ncbi:MAG: divalent metal cation (Fe/Co/Zn/Cd) transporter [Hyphomicrobiaceae bacterium]
MVAVDRTLTTDEAHGIADAIEEVLARRLAITDVTVHIEPGKD